MFADLATRPTAAASLIKPPFAGSQVSEIIRTCSSSIAVKASASTEPSDRHGITLITTPARVAAACIVARFPPHSCRPTRMRSPGFRHRGPYSAFPLDNRFNSYRRAARESRCAPCRVGRGARRRDTVMVNTGHGRALRPSPRRRCRSLPAVTLWFSSPGRWGTPMPPPGLGSPLFDRHHEQPATAGTDA